MAIEIVKEGCKKFNMTCSNCGCEFTYEYEDVGVGVTPYIGDNPCQWCQKNPNKITCTSGGSNV